MRRNVKSNTGTAFAYLMPRPDLVVGALADLGLSDEKIGRYFGVDEADIAVIPHVPLGMTSATRTRRRSGSRAGEFANEFVCAS